MIMTLDQFLVIIGHVATWTTVYIVFLTLKEMSIQRKASYKPELIVTKKHVFGYYTQFGELMLPTKWSENKLEQKELLSEDIDIDYNLTIFNIGMGTAIDIELKWDFNISGTIKFIKDYCYKYSLPVIVDIDENNFLNFKIKKFRCSINLKNDLKYTYDYLLPTSVSSKGLEIPIPYSIRILISMWVYLINLELEKEKNFLKKENLLSDEWPLPSLSLNYRDIGKVEHKKRIVSKISVFSIASGNFEKGDEGFSGQIKLDKG